MDNKIVVFQDIQIRKIWHNDEWYFSVVDIVKALTDSPNPRQYWGKVKDRAFKALELSPIWVRLKLPAEDSKMRFTDCVNTESAFSLRFFLKDSSFKDDATKVNCDEYLKNKLPGTIVKVI